MNLPLETKKYPIKEGSSEQALERFLYDKLKALISNCISDSGDGIEINYFTVFTRVNHSLQKMSQTRFNIKTLHPKPPTITIARGLFRKKEVIELPEYETSYLADVDLYFMDNSLHHTHVTARETSHLPMAQMITILLSEYSPVTLFYPIIPEENQNGKI